MSVYGNNEKDMYCGKDARDGKDSCGGKNNYYDKEPSKEKEYGESDLCECKFAKHISKYVGETVTVFTESGGLSGCGFTGFLIDVSCCFIRIISKQGTEPACPLGSSCCCDSEGAPKAEGSYGAPQKKQYYSVGSVTDIPIDKIVAFTHNAV